MFNTSRHPSDEEILQFIDSELPSNRSEQLRKHFATCAECHDRRAFMERNLKRLDEFYNSEQIVPNSRMGVSRIRLQSGLAAYRSNPSQVRDQAAPKHSGLPILALATLAILALTFSLGKRVWRTRPGILSSGQTMLIPNSSLTPGAVRPVTLNEICSVSESNDLDPKVSSSTARAVLKEYGLPSDTAVALKYQIDYLVNPQLGGTDDIRNLWPQPYSNGAWNAQAKDVLEQHLHQMVCNRRVNLAEAQRELSADWIAAYKKYLGRVGS